MAQYETTGLGSPISIPNPVKVRVSPNKTATALAALSSIGAKASKMAADEQEVNLKRQAANDLVNNTVNPDLTMNSSAYSSIVAEGQALKRFNEYKQGIQDNKYDDIEPQEFQKSIGNAHKEFYKEWRDNKNSSTARDAYNTFFLKNEATLTAAQAGKFRVRQGEKMGTALNSKLSEMVKSGNYTTEDYKEEIYSPKYTLLDEKARMQVAFSTASEVAEETGDTTVLEDFNTEFGFDVSPVFGRAYDSAISQGQAKAREKHNADIAEFHEYVNVLAGKGVLNITYDKMLDMTKDYREGGKPLYTPREWGSLRAQSSRRLITEDVQEQYNKALKEGSLKPGGSTSMEKKAITNLHAELAATDATPEEIARTVGPLIKKAHEVDKVYQDMAVQLKSVDPLNKDGSPNESFVKTFNTLSVFRDAMDSPTRFREHLDDDSDMIFKLMDHSVKLSGKDYNAGLHNGVQQVQKFMDRRAQGLPVYSKLPTEYRDVVQKAVKNKYQGWWGFTGVPDDKLIDTQRSVEQTMLYKLNTGTTDGIVMEDQVEELLDIQYPKMFGKPQFTAGAPLGLQLGGDPEKTIGRYINKVLPESFKGLDDSDMDVNINTLEQTITVTDMTQVDTPSMQYHFKEVLLNNALDTYNVKYQDKDISTDGLDIIFNRHKAMGQSLGSTITEDNPLYKESARTDKQDTYFINNLKSLTDKFFVDVIQNPEYQDLEGTITLPTEDEWINLSLQEKGKALLLMESEMETGKGVIRSIFDALTTPPDLMSVGVRVLGQVTSPEALEGVSQMVDQTGKKIVFPKGETGKKINDPLKGLSPRASRVLSEYKEYLNE